MQYNSQLCERSELELPTVEGFSGLLSFLQVAIPTYLARQSFHYSTSSNNSKELSPLSFITLFISFVSETPAMGVRMVGILHDSGDLYDWPIMLDFLVIVETPPYSRFLPLYAWRLH